MDSILLFKASVGTGLSKKFAAALSISRFKVTHQSNEFNDFTKKLRRTRSSEQEREEQEDEEEGGAVASKTKENGGGLAEERGEVDCRLQTADCRQQTACRRGRRPVAPDL